MVTEVPQTSGCGMTALMIVSIREGGTSVSRVPRYRSPDACGPRADATRRESLPGAFPGSPERSPHDSTVPQNDVDAASAALLRQHFGWLVEHSGTATHPFDLCYRHRPPPKQNLHPRALCDWEDRRSPASTVYAAIAPETMSMSRRMFRRLWLTTGRSLRAQPRIKASVRCSASVTWPALVTACASRVESKYSRARDSTECPSVEFSQIPMSLLRKTQTWRTSPSRGSHADACRRARSPCPS